MHLSRALTILSLLSLFTLSNAQVKTNFELIDSLIKISANEISKQINVDESYKLNYKSAEEYSVLENTVIKYLQENKIRIVSNNNILNFTLEEAKIYYPEMFRDGLFGEYLIDRTAEIRISYFTAQNENIGEVNWVTFTINDSVPYSEIPKLENIAYSFTSAKLPDEPFFSSTLEPVIAIGTAAVAVYLFFNIRSR